MRKSQLLFVTFRDENLDDGFSYAVELAKRMFQDITLLLVQKKNRLRNNLEKAMTAVTFAEAGELDTARQVMAAAAEKSGPRNKFAGLIQKCSHEGIAVEIQVSDQDAISGIQSYLKEHRRVDKVVLSPFITNTGEVTARELNRLVRAASRPIITMSRQA